MKYGRLVSDSIEYAPRTIYIDDVPIANPTHVQYIGQGWKPVFRAVFPPKSPKDGWHFEQFGWVDKESCIAPRWRLVRDSPDRHRIFSKFALEGKLFEEGLMDQVDAFIDSQVITNQHGQTMPLRRRYNTALEFSEDHPDFDRVFKALKQLLGVTDEKAEEILAASVKE